MFKRLFFLSCCTLLLAGCSLQQVLPAQSEYTLHVRKSTKVYAQSSCKMDVLRVRALDENSLTTSDSIYYTIGKYKRNSYSESRWLQMPSQKINALLIDSLRRSEMFKDVQSKRSYANANLTLQYNVEDFMQYFSADMKSSYVVVKIHFALINPKDEKILYAITQSAQVQVNSLNALGGVKALSQALGEVLEQNEEWIYENMCHKGK